jgi:hypothetical protein
MKRQLHRRGALARPLAVFLLTLCLLALLIPARVSAHGGHGPTTLQTFTQAVGPYELAVTVELPFTVPSTLYLTTAPLGDIGDTTITFRAVPRGQSFDGAPAAQIKTLPGLPTVYYSELQVDRAGDWDIEVRAEGPKGSGVARIPVTIVIQPLSSISIALLAALGGLILLMITSILLGVIFQRRQRPMPGWANWALGQGIFVCIILAIVFGVQQFAAQIQSAQAAANPNPAVYGRPHANMALHTAPAAPAAGQPLTLTLDLSDGSTGLPVEDIVPHHDALVHLVVISADSADFHHLHPARIAPGRYEIAFTPGRAGRYSAYAEIQRQDSGTQVIARDFEVAGTAAGSAAPAPGLGAREVAGMQVTVASSLTPLRVGKQATFTFHFTERDAPVLDIQAWLGMAGHLIARSEDGATFAHIHAAEAMAPSEPLLASGTVYGPNIRFAYTFPQPGRYQLWAQFKRNGAILTVPMVVQVEQ